MEVEFVLSVAELADVGVVLLLRVLPGVKVLPVGTLLVRVVKVKLDRLLPVFFALPVHHHQDQRQVRHSRVRGLVVLAHFVVEVLRANAAPAVDLVAVVVIAVGS